MDGEVVARASAARSAPAVSGELDQQRARARARARNIGKLVHW